VEFIHWKASYPPVQDFDVFGRMSMAAEIIPDTRKASDKSNFSESYPWRNKIEKSKTNVVIN
jgi:hypothetical protein